MSNKKIRTSQLLSPFGIGQIVNFPKEVSVMICGLNLWERNIQSRKLQNGQNIDEKFLQIKEERLQKLLEVDYFVRPFPHKDSGINSKLEIPAVRFPQWHHCTNIKCGFMTEVELTFSSTNKTCSKCDSKMIPVRFVAACPEGHIQDVPFKTWVHNGPIPKDGSIHQLYYQSLSGSGDLGSILIRCSCGQSKTLAGIMNVHKTGDQIFNSALASIGIEESKFSEENPNNSNSTGEYCKGYRPWLGLEGVNNPVKCGRHLHVLVRGGSNVHFADIKSALFLPQVSSGTNSVAEKIINRLTKKILKGYYDHDEGVGFLPAILGTQPEVTDGHISKEELLKIVLEEIQEEEPEEENEISENDIRYQEYEYILRGYNSENSEFKALKNEFEEYQNKLFLENFFECTVLVEKLKETRVFKGFSRISPTSITDKNQLSLHKVKWLPANEVYGEGIFLKFRDDKIDKWLNENDQYFSKVLNRYFQAQLARNPLETPRELNSTFLLLHTFAHLLIKRLCFNCGYGSSSLRERIYFSSNNEKRMNGILIYTSSGDSEGSLGGLVRQGNSENLAKLIKDAIEDSRWCSADPVCSDIGQNSGQGPDNVNGSACHNCCIVPETSCEEFNMVLDRATISGTLDRENGYFQFLE